MRQMMPESWDHSIESQKGHFPCEHEAEADEHAGERLGD